MYKLKTRVDFECAHRLFGVDTYSEECRNNLHGHSYKVTVIVGRESLNDAGMVIDFKLLKKILNESITERYDHACIVRNTDPLSSYIYDNCKKVIIVEDSPTAEWMAKTYFTSITSALTKIDKDIKVISVAVQETDHNIAIYEE